MLGKTHDLMREHMEMLAAHFRLQVTEEVRVMDMPPLPLSGTVCGTGMKVRSAPSSGHRS